MTAAGGRGDKKPALFLDRDGVLTREKGYVASLKELSIFPYTAGCIRLAHEKGYLAIVVTNQSGVARGLFTEEILIGMNEQLMRQSGVDAVYYCPHHPDIGDERYRKKCRCRKPDTGLLERACQDFGIDLEHSYMVGDRAGDIMTGQKMGIKTVLLNSGYGMERLENDVEADYVFEDLVEFAEFLPIIGNTAVLYDKN